MALLRAYVAHEAHWTGDSEHSHIGIARRWRIPSGEVAQKVAAGRQIATLLLDALPQAERVLQWRAGTREAARI